MRRWRGVAFGTTFLAMTVVPGQSCGPFFTDAIFVLHQPESRETLMSGRPGIIWTDFGYADMALAYRALQGPAFTAGEVQGEKQREPPADGTADNASRETGVAQWAEARKAFTGQDGGPIPTDATIPGQQWQSYGNCLEDAFTTAAKTLQSRERDYAGVKPAVAEWMRGQDAVFTNCGGSGELPAEADSSAPNWLRSDRAYQLAAAHFYRAEWQPAQNGFRAIADDPASPWRELAPYMEARSLVRQAMLSKPDSIDLASMKAAKTILQDSLRRGGRYANAAQALLSYVELRLTPGTTAARLGEAIAAQDAHLYQDLIDFRFALNSPGLEGNLADARRSDLVDWVLTTRGNSGVDNAAAHAFERWRVTKSVVWLASAIMLAQTPSPDLLAAAAAVPQASPAWATVTYHRLRLTQNQLGFESEVAGLLPRIDNISTRNAFQEFAQTNAGSLDSFLKLAAMVPAAYDDGMGDMTSTSQIIPGSTDSKPATMAGLPVHSPDARRFNEKSAIVLNEQLSLGTLAAIVQRRSFSKQLQFELAMAVWTRAVLLDKPEIARSLTSSMIEGEPGWKQWLSAYDNAKSDDDRRLAALQALMRFPSVRPYVNAGPIREEGFAGYSEYRDNWWCAGMGKQANGIDSYKGYYNFQGGPQPITGVKPTPLPVPSFITAEMLSQAAMESAALSKIGDAPGYFGEQALAWVKAHPKDPRDAELLGFTFRAMRNGCNLEKSVDVRREVFDTLHARFGQSEWARRYKSRPD